MVLALLPSTEAFGMSSYLHLHLRQKHACFAWCVTSWLFAGGDGTGAAGGTGGNGGDAATSVGRKLQGAPSKKPAPTITTTGGNGGNGGGASNKGKVTGGNGGNGQSPLQLPCLAHSPPSRWTACTRACAATNSP